MPTPDLNVWDRLAGVWRTLQGIWTQARPIIGDIWNTLKDLGRTLARAAESLGVSTWQLFVTALETAARILSVTVAPALQVISTVLRGVGTGSKRTPGL
jgi:hypothetical protein